MEYSPPPLFKQGAPARVKVTVFALLSIVLLVADARFHALNVVRQVAGTVLYPLQMAALMPRNAVASMGDYFSSISALQREVRELKSRQVAMAQSMQQAQLQTVENAQLRRLMDAREHLPVRSMMSEILYDARDPSTRRVVLDRGAQSGVKPGLPVIDNAGVVGQVTRVFPFTSEVTLLTDKEQAIPVQVLRSGLRSVAYGRGQSGLLDLRFVAPNADVQVGDVLVTSGLDGMYPAGLAVAKVVQVESVANGAFGRVVCQPLAGIDRFRQLLVVMSDQPMPPRPAEAAKTVANATPVSKRNLPKMEPIPMPPLPAQPLPAAAPANAPGGARAGVSVTSANAAVNLPPVGNASAGAPAAAAPPGAQAGTHAPMPAILRAGAPADTPAAGAAAPARRLPATVASPPAARAPAASTGASAAGSPAAGSPAAGSSANAPAAATVHKAGEGA